MTRKPDSIVRLVRRRWNGLLGIAAGLAFGAPAASVAGIGLGLAVLVGTVAVAVGCGQLIGVLRRRIEGWAVSPDDLLVVSGILRRRTILLFAEKVQAIEIVTGPLQRRLGLVARARSTSPRPPT